MEVDSQEEILENVVEDDDESNQITSSELIVMMEEIWCNEKFAPEILPHKQEVVDCVMDQISYMEQNLETLNCTDFKKGIHQLEVDRIRFLVTSYLRQRLEKIETYVFCILKEEETRSRQGEDGYLMEAELTFATQYKQALEQHFENVTNFYPGMPYQEWKKHDVTPNLNSFLFLRGKNVVDGVLVNTGREDAEVVDINIGSQLFISYNSVADLVKKGDVCLI